MELHPVMYANTRSGHWCRAYRENGSVMAEPRRLLLLLRHAKSSWDDPMLADHDRPLGPRGRKAAKLISEHLREQRIGVSLVLSSSARRARETVDLVKPPGELRVERGLYAASADLLLERVRSLPLEATTVMIVGHNPGLHELATRLVRDPGALTEKFPTGALAMLSFTGPWSGLSFGDAELVAFVTPRELG